MRSIDELTDAEAAALSEEDIKRHIDLRCAERGIPLLPPIPVEPDPVDARPDLECYYTCGETFADKTEAESVAEFVAARPSRRDVEYLNNWSGPQTVKVAESGVSVTVHRYWSAAHHEKHSYALTLHERAKKAYKEEMNSYAAIRADREEAVNHVGHRVESACADQILDRRIREHYHEYLDLADGDHLTAMTFFIKACQQYGYDEDRVRKIVEGVSATRNLNVIDVCDRSMDTLVPSHEQ